MTGLPQNTRAPCDWEIRKLYRVLFGTKTRWSVKSEGSPSSSRSPNLLPAGRESRLRADQVVQFFTSDG